MFNFIKKKMSAHMRLEIETKISTHLNNLVPFKSESTIDLSLAALVALSEALHGIPEGASVEVKTLNHHKLTITKRGGKFKTKL